MEDLTGKKIAIVATDYFEEAELVEPLTSLRDRGAEVIVAAPHADVIKALRHIEPGQEVPVDTTIDQLEPEEYDGAVIPGGVVNADHLRVDMAAQEFIRGLDKAGKPVAAICHGPWLLISAGLVKDRTLTSYPTLADDIKNAGANWVNEEVMVDGNIITSRKPADIPVFVAAFAKALI